MSARPAFIPDLPLDVADPSLPPRIGKYRVVSRLGDGATSEVFLAEDDFHHQQVAIKRVDGGQFSQWAHALLREQALATIGTLRRCRIHLRVAAELASRDGPDAKARRAAHLLEALPVAQASEVVVACCAAADDAIAHWDSESAARWLDAAPRSVAERRTDHAGTHQVVFLVELSLGRLDGQRSRPAPGSYLGDAGDLAFGEKS